MHLVSVYCCAGSVKIVSGTASAQIRVVDFHISPLPEGLLINGIITDEEALSEALRALKNSGALPKKPLSLIVDSGSIILRPMTVPVLKESEILGIVSREITLYQERAEDLVFDYAVLKPEREGGGAEILGIAAGKEFLESYLRVFKNAGCEVCGVDNGINCQNKLVGAMPALQDKTYILALVEENNLILTLYEKGSYNIANRYRLFSEYGSEDWAGEIGSSISSMVQFNKGRRENSEITAVFIAGVPEQFRAMLGSARLGINLPVERIPAPDGLKLTGAAQGREDFHLSEFVYNIGGLL